MKKCLVILADLALLAAICGLALGFLYNQGIICFNNPSAREFPVRGVDVSAYQGAIDWEILAAQNIRFAFIKATEGSSFVDPMFADNFSKAVLTDLRIGAYHFFSFDSQGWTQAENFMAIVPKSEGMLPPVVDLEFYGDKGRHPPARDAVQKELTVFLTRLEDHYGLKPLIYTAARPYELYIRGSYQDYGIWFRSVFTKPLLDDGRAWTIWQYCDRGRLEGYIGPEKFIDLDVFNGTLDDFMLLGNRINPINK